VPALVLWSQIVGACLCCSWKYISWGWMKEGSQILLLDIDVAASGSGVAFLYLPP